MSLKVDNLKIYPVVASCIDLQIFDVDIDNRKTRCYANFAEGWIYIHWRPSKVLLMDDYERCGTDMVGFIADNLEDAITVEEYEKQQQVLNAVQLVMAKL